MDVNLNSVGVVNGQPNGINRILSDEKPVKASRTNSQVFDDFLDAAKGIYKETNSTLNGIADFQLKVATGESDDFVGLSLMQSKATASMQFFTQLTNKSVEAYREIMRMQI